MTSFPTFTLFSYVLCAKTHLSTVTGLMNGGRIDPKFNMHKSAPPADALIGMLEIRSV